MCAASRPQPTRRTRWKLVANPGWQPGFPTSSPSGLRPLDVNRYWNWPFIVQCWSCNSTKYSVIFTIILNYKINDSERLSNALLLSSLFVLSLPPWTKDVNPLTPTVAISVPHPAKNYKWHHGLTRFGTGCFIAVPCPYGISGRQMVNKTRKD